MKNALLKRKPVVHSCLVIMRCSIDNIFPVQVRITYYLWLQLEFIAAIMVSRGQISF